MAGTFISLAHMKLTYPTNNLLSKSSSAGKRQDASTARTKLDLRQIRLTMDI